MRDNGTFLPSYIIGSSYRREVFFEISKKKMVLQKDLITTTSHKYRSHVRRTLKDLTEKGLIVCKNPEDTRYKFYELSEKGKELKEEMKKYGYFVDD